MIDRANIWMQDGEDLAIEQLSGINDNMQTSHYHEFYELYYLESGERYHLLNDQLYKLTPSQLILFEPYQLHYSYGDPNIGFSRILLYFNDKYISPEIISHLKGLSGVYQLSPEDNMEFYQMLRKVLQEKITQSEFYETSTATLLNQLLVMLLRTKTAKKEVYSNTRITQIISYINQHYTEKLTTEELANEFYISKWHLCREFKESTQTTIIQYINNIRIINAQKLLARKDLSITAVSSEVGFESVTHFQRVFKQIAGMTPSEYKKRV